MGRPVLPRIVALAAALWLSAARPAAADEWVIEVGPEAAGAVAAGAADIKRANQLAKQKKYADAVEVFEAVARRSPAALHDCYLALAYLRAGALTRAQLLWDVGRMRNTDRPGWCTGDLGQQLATALRAAKFVPLTITVVPAAAVVRVGGVSVRGVSVIWLPAGPHRVTASAPDLADGLVEVDVKAPSATATLALAPPAPPPDPKDPPTGPPAGPGPAITEPTVIEAPPLQPAVQEPPPGPPAPAVLPPAGPVATVAKGARRRPARWPGWVAAGAGGVGLLTGGLFHARAIDARDDANALYPTQPEFDAADARFGRERNRALIGYGLGTIAVGVGLWWLLAHAGGDR
jgi:hypothetical protein